MRGTVDQWAYSLLISFRFQGAQDRNLRKPLFLLEHKIKPQKKKLIGSTVTRNGQME